MEDYPFKLLTDTHLIVPAKTNTGWKEENTVPAVLDILDGIAIIVFTQRLKISARKPYPYSLTPVPEQHSLANVARHRRPVKLWICQRAKVVCMELTKSCTALKECYLYTLSVCCASVFGFNSVFISCAP